MDYWRIRKEWNNGKWDKTQVGAYNTYESALSNYKNEYKEQGYKIFSPIGEVLYPNNDIVQMMLDDGLTLDVSYWNNVFNNNEYIDHEHVKELFIRYSKLLNNNADNADDAVIDDNNDNNDNGLTEVIKFNDINIYKVPINNFKIKIVDKQKYNINEESYFNAGYFANYNELSYNKIVKFTLPVANLVADYSFDDLPEVSHKYWRERKHDENKMYFGANDNTAEFKNKLVSTLIVTDSAVKIEKINDVKDIENIQYAVSGCPIIINNEYATINDALAEGWSTGITRSTMHTFVGIKNDKCIYCFGYNTTKSGSNMFDEVQSIFKDFKFKSLIKLDGGGSFIEKFNNEYKLCTGENRQINNIITIQ